MGNESWQRWIAIYAAIVATGALFLEIRRWFESKPRLSISVAKNMKMFGVAYEDDQTYLIVNVVNRGGLPTTLTHLAIFQYPTWLARWRRKHKHSGLVPNPTGGFGGPQFPHFLEAGKLWMGLVVYDNNLSEFAKEGLFYVGVIASDREHPRLRRVHLTTEEIDKVLTKI